jgi:hypothetical protein
VATILVGVIVGKGQRHVLKGAAADTAISACAVAAKVLVLEHVEVGNDRVNVGQLVPVGHAAGVAALVADEVLVDGHVVAVEGKEGALKDQYMILTTRTIQLTTPWTQMVWYTWGQCKSSHRVSAPGMPALEGELIKQRSAAMYEDFSSSERDVLEESVETEFGCGYNTYHGTRYVISVQLSVISRLI